MLFSSCSGSMTVTVNVGLDCLAGASLSLTKEESGCYDWSVCFQVNINSRSSFKFLQPSVPLSPLSFLFFLMQTFSLVVLF